MNKLFTLIELIVVIVVISILAAIVIPNIADIREKATVSALDADARNIETAVDMYVHKNNGAYPTEDGTEVIPSITTSVAFDREQHKDVLAEEVEIEELVSEGYLRKSPKNKSAKFYLVEGGDVIWVDVRDNGDNTGGDNTGGGNTGGGEIVVDPNLEIYYSHVDGEVTPSPASDFIYTVAENGVTITGYKGTITDIVIPYEIEGKPVTTIGAGAFNVNLGKSTVYITSIVIPSSVVTLETTAFMGTRVESLIFPGSIESIPTYTIAGSYLKSIELKDGVKRIETRAFMDSTSLEEVIMADSVDYMDTAVFRNTALTNIDFLSPNIKTIDAQAFAVTKITGTLNIPSHIENIYGNTFSWNTISQVNISAGTKNIHGTAFTGQSQIQNDYLSLPVMNIAPSSPYLKLSSNGKSVLSKDGNKIFVGHESIIGTSEYNALTTIGAYAFNLMKNPSGTLNLPPNLQKIEEGAFNSGHFDTIVIPSTVTSIEKYSFYSTDVTKVIDKSYIITETNRRDYFSYMPTIVRY